VLGLDALCDDWRRFDEASRVWLLYQSPRSRRGFARSWAKNALVSEWCASESLHPDCAAIGSTSAWRVWRLIWCWPYGIKARGRARSRREHDCQPRKEPRRNARSLALRAWNILRGYGSLVQARRRLASASFLPLRSERAGHSHLFDGKRSRSRR